ncbi:hypothetical protein LTR53_015048 [Teratosphaeriaceae sp. CCFEE 6253]|nr:hypothetical protein LTR53_015048 [Teratosphaeriaceae sp. CCFEE 6253]
MQLAIQYRDLTWEQKLEIFKTLLSKLPSEDVENPQRMYKPLEKLCRRSEINGRQIRNIVSSALLLARNENVRLSFEQLEAVHEMTMKFIQSLKDKTLLARNTNEAFFKDLSLVRLAM